MSKKEIEFVCVNPNFPNTTKQENQDKLFESLKTVESLIVYRQDFEEHNSLAVIINTPSKRKMLTILPQIKALATQCQVEVDFIQEVSNEFVSSVKNGTLEYLTDKFQT